MNKKQIGFIIGALIIGIMFGRKFPEENTPQWKKENGIVGTYVTGDRLNRTDFYLAFISDGRYVYYKQGSLLDQGTYQFIGEGLYELHSVEKGKKEEDQALIFVENKIYYKEENKGWVIFTWLNKTPSLINVEAKELEEMKKIRRMQ